MAEIYDSSILGILGIFAFLLFLEFLNLLQCGLTGIILGHKRNNAKTGLSVLFGAIAFFLSQTVLVVIFFAIAVFNKDFMNLFVTNTMPDIQTIKTVSYLAIIGYAAISVAVGYVNIRLFKKGVNVD